MAVQRFRTSFSNSGPELEARSFTPPTLKIRLGPTGDSLQTRLNSKHFDDVRQRRRRRRAMRAAASKNLSPASTVNRLSRRRSPFKSQREESFDGASLLKVQRQISEQKRFCKSHCNCKSYYLMLYCYLGT